MMDKSVLSMRAGEVEKISATCSIGILIIMIILGSALYVKAETRNTEREIKATGTGLPPDKAEKRAEKCAYAERAAEINARAKLLEQVSVGITTEAANEGFTLSQADVVSYAKGSLIGSEILETKEIGECDSVKVTIVTHIDLKEAAKKITTSR